LAQITEASLTVFRGTPDFAAEFIHRPNDQRQQKGATQGHLPIDAEQNGDKYGKRKSFLKQVGEPFAEGKPYPLDVVDGGGNETPGRIVLEEADGLAKDAGVNLVPQIGDGSEAGILNLGGADVFGKGFCKKENDERNGEDGPDVVDARGEIIIEVNDLSA